MLGLDGVAAELRDGAGSFTRVRRAIVVYTDFVYTLSVLSDLLGFDWDVHNVGHVALHDVVPEEVEQATRQRHIVIPAAPRGGEKRWKLFGRTEADRYLVVVFTIRRRRFRPVTAYTMNRAERRLYAPKIED
jgi:uncharacterized protein